MTHTTQNLRRLISSLWKAMALLALSACGSGESSSSNPAQPSTPAQLERSFQEYMWVGNPDGFTDAELTRVAHNAVVVIAKFHAGNDRNNHHQAVRAIKARALALGLPAPRVLAYVGMRYRFCRDIGPSAECGRPNAKPFVNPDPFNTEYVQGVNDDGFQPSWYLLDQAGNRAQSDEEAERTPAFFIDLTNPGYRAWVQNNIKRWVTVYGYDGVAFDNSPYAGVGNDFDRLGPLTRERYRLLFGDERYTRLFYDVSTGALGEWNLAIQKMLSETKAMLSDPAVVGANKPLVIYNGIAFARTQEADRSLSLLPFADGAHNERFCVDGRVKAQDAQGITRSVIWDAAQQRKEVEVLAQYSGDKLMFAKTLYEYSDSTGADLTTPDERARVSDFCLALFAMGIGKPENAFFNFSGGYPTTLPNWDLRPPHADAKYGAPAAPVRTHANGLLSREYQGGFVVVNTTDQPLLLVDALCSPDCLAQVQVDLSLQAQSAAFLSKR
jgi:hypothetical protein